MTLFAELNLDTPRRHSVAGIMVMAGADDRQEDGVLTKHRCLPAAPLEAAGCAGGAGDGILLRPVGHAISQTVPSTVPSSFEEMGGCGWEMMTWELQAQQRQAFHLFLAQQQAQQERMQHTLFDRFNSPSTGASQFEPEHGAELPSVREDESMAAPATLPPGSFFEEISSDNSDFSVSMRGAVMNLQRCNPRIIQSAPSYPSSGDATGRLRGKFSLRGELFHAFLSYRVAAEGPSGNGLSGRIAESIRSPLSPLFNPRTLHCKPDALYPNP